MKTSSKEEVNEKHNVPPVDKKTWLCLREFALRRTREEGRLVTQGEIVEKSIQKYIEEN